MNHNIFVSQQNKSGLRDCVPIMVSNAEEMKRKECVEARRRPPSSSLPYQKGGKPLPCSVSVGIYTVVWGKTTDFCLRQKDHPEKQHRLRRARMACWLYAYQWLAASYIWE